MKIMRCDKCKEEYEGIQADKIKIVELHQNDKHNIKNIVMSLDLCQTCISETIRFMKGE